MSMKDESRLFKKMEDDLYREAKEERERIKKESVPYSTLTKREAFAALAMQGFLTGVETIIDKEIVATHAIQYADALIKALEEK